MTAIFVTGTGTDVGKTFVTASLIRYMRGNGRGVRAIKPVASGFDAAAPDISDTGVLLAALGRPMTAEEIDAISPWRFAAPMSPDIAAERERRSIDFDAVVAFTRRAIEATPANEFLLIEGIGGIMVPLDKSHTVLDWMMAVRVPVVLVAGSYLGTISHTLTALQVLARQNLELAGLVVSESAESTTRLADTVTTIAHFAGETPIVALHRLADDTAIHPGIGHVQDLI